MADDQFNTGGGANWWDSSSRNRFDASVGSSSSSPGLNAGFGWPTEMAEDVKVRSNSMDSASASSVVFQEKLHESGGGGDHHPHHLQMMGLGLSSQPVDWNQALLRGDKTDHNTSFRSILQENINTNSNYHHHESCSIASSISSPVNDFKHMNRGGFFLDQSQFSPHGSSTDSTVTPQGFHIENNSSASNLYGTPTMFHGLLGPSDHSHHHPQQYGAASANYGMNSNTNEMLHSSWHRPSLVPSFLRAPVPQKQVLMNPHSQLQFSNNAPFWSPSATMTEVRPSFFPMQPAFEEKPKNLGEIRDSSSIVKKSGNDQPAAKKARNETTSSSPAFKVRKEKMGDRIAALQQLVSPFGKTDAASVLSEAIEYIKFLHEQVAVLSAPYMKSGVVLQHQQTCDNPKDPEGPRQDLRSRGLCLVPVSSTFPVTHETTVDFWTPTFGGTFR